MYLLIFHVCIFFRLVVGLESISGKHLRAYAAPSNDMRSRMIKRSFAGIAVRLESRHIGGSHVRTYRVVATTILP
jgi:hypothetical protein